MRLLLTLTALLQGVQSLKLKGLYGEFASPGFPSIYPNNVQENWTITVPKGDVIKLFFTYFSLEPSHLCESDYVKIISEGKELATFCGETSTDTEKVPGDTAIYSTGNTMSVVFRSDYSSEQRFTGFKAFYTAEGKFYCTCKDGDLLHENERPSKVKKCTEPDPISNATVTYLTGENITTYQSVIQYKCDEPFYTLKPGSNDTYTCAADGYWVDSNGNRQLPICEPVCGKQTNGSLLRIMGGRKARLGEFPWQVLISVNGNPAGGALVYDNWILTAAQVLYHYDKSSSINIKLGLVDRSSTDYLEAWPEHIFIHPDHKSATGSDNNDIALIKLNHKVPISANVMPICLPGRDEKYNVATDNIGVVSGWGQSRQSSNTAKHLMFVELEVVEHKKCKDAFGTKISPESLTDNMLCAGPEEGGKDACTGDSGGALVFQDRETRKLFVGGIVSWGVGCGVAGHYGVYTKVYNYISWIEKIISKYS